jgi:Zn-dependent protease with chaperone function
MLLASLALAVFAVLLAWPIPVLLGHASWTAHAPVTALLLWQAIALAGGLSMIGALLTFGLYPFGDRFVESVLGLGGAAVSGRLGDVPLLGALALCGALLLTLHLLLNLGYTAIQIQRQRRRHRQLVELLSTPHRELKNTRLLETSVPLAYCLPGSHNPITVFSAGLVAALTPDELSAVLEHERAHLTQKHYLVLLAFVAWHRSLPWFPIARQARHEVALLVEMLADDHARQTVSDQVLASAITRVRASDPTASQSFDPYDRHLSARVQRLTDPVPVNNSLRVAVSLGTIALIAVPTTLLLAPSVVEWLS